jgi:hypothetical protein
MAKKNKTVHADSIDATQLAVRDDSPDVTNPVVFPPLCRRCGRDLADPVEVGSTSREGKLTCVTCLGDPALPHRPPGHRWAARVWGEGRGDVGERGGEGGGAMTRHTPGSLPRRRKAQAIVPGPRCV